MAPENACKLKIDVDVKTHASMALRTAILKGILARNMTKMLNVVEPFEQWFEYLFRWR